MSVTLICIHNNPKRECYVISSLQMRYFYNLLKNSQLGSGSIRTQIKEVFLT